MITFAQGLRAIIGRHLVAVAIALLAIKLAEFAVDSAPLLFMGDSARYLETALTGRILTSRSFTYGFLIGWLTVWSGTLTTLVLAQVLMGAATAWLLALALLRFFDARPAVAFGAAIVFALDPMQILHERLVLTETSTLFIFAGHMLLSFWYLSRPRVLSLMGVCLTGILLVSLRTLYVSVVLSTAAVLPLLRWLNLSEPQERSRWTKHCMMHLAVAVLVSLGLHSGYRQLVGGLTGLPPAYQYYDGFYLTAAWAPMLKPEDADDPRAEQAVKKQSTSRRLPLGDRSLRWAQIWHFGGLASKLKEVFDQDFYSANHAAKRMYMRALRRDPVIPLREILLTYRDHLAFFYDDYWKGHDRLRRRLLEEQGTSRPPRQRSIKILKDRYGLDAGNGNFRMTPSKQYHLAGAPYYAYLLLSPLASAIGIWLCRRGRRRQAVYAFFASAVLLATTFAASCETMFRYLHPLSFTGLIALGVILDALWPRKANGN